MGQFSGQGSRLGVGQFTSFFSIVALLQGAWAVFSAAKLTLYVGICSNPHTGSFGSFRAALSIYASKLYQRFTVFRQHQPLSVLRYHATLDAANAMTHRHSMPIM